MLPVHVISLPGSTTRRMRARTRLEAAGVAFEFFDAHDGEHGRALLDDVDEASFTVMTGRAVQPGEIGCYASHLALWRLCVETGAPLLILEDDFDLSPDFRAAVQEAGRVVERCGFVRLQSERGAWSVAAGRSGEFELRRYTKAPQELLCYAVSPAAAARFVARSRVMFAPVDVFMIREWDHGQAMYALTPYTVEHCANHDGSIIGERPKAPKSLGTRLARTAEKSRRLAWRGGLHAALKLRARESR